MELNDKLEFRAQFVGEIGECLRRERIQIMSYPVLPENSPSWEQNHYFTIRTGILQHYYRIPWQVLYELPLAEAYALQAQGYLDAIWEIPAIRGMKKRRFDVQKFHEDAPPIVYWARLDTAIRLKGRLLFSVW
jgi:hypothetical protein